jgi:hypothetical protein
MRIIERQGHLALPFLDSDTMIPLLASRFQLHPRAMHTISS